MALERENAVLGCEINPESLRQGCLELGQFRVHSHDRTLGRAADRISNAPLGAAQTLTRPFVHATPIG